MIGRREKSPDLISRIATIGPPIYVLIRLATSDWRTWLVYLAVFMIVAAFYAFVIVPGINWDADDGKTTNQMGPDSPITFGPR